MRLKKTSIFLILQILIAITVPPVQAKLICKYVYPIQQAFVEQHVNYDKDVLTFSLAEKLPGKPSPSLAMRKLLEGRTVDQYIKRFDTSKLYLLDQDRAELRKMLTGIFKSVSEENCAPLVLAQKLFNKRVKQRAEFAKKYLSSKSFKFNKNTNLILDPDKREVPKTQKDLDDFQKKYIQFQLSNYLATDVGMDEAKQYVIRNYERVVKRMGDYSTEEIYGGYLDSFARSLDPHSSYLPQDVLEDFEISMRLSLEGIGATLTSEDGFTVIEQLIPGGAAFRSGQLTPKDRIIGVGQGKEGPIDNVIEMDLRDVVGKIRGKKGTEVRLSILRKEKGGPKRFEVVLVRDQIKLEDEAAAVHYLEKEVDGAKKLFAIVDLPSFYSDSRRNGRSAAGDVRKLLKEAREKGVAGMVLDLSSNPGGSLDDAVKLAGLFFAKGAVVKQSSKRYESDNNSVLADVDSTVDYAGPLVVLTSRLSASASEIVAGTLKDYGRAVVVGGDHTFGKGTVQQVIPLPLEKLGALKVTVGMFFVPGGYSTQHLGVDSDIVFPSALHNDEIGEKTLDYSLPVQKIKPFLSPSAFVDEGPSRWARVSEETVKDLKAKSMQRIKSNPEFQKIEKELASHKAEEAKVIKLDEVMKKAEDEEKKKKDRYSKNKDEKEKDYLARADVQESLNILLDLVRQTSGGTGVTLGAHQKPGKADSDIAN